MRAAPRPKPVGESFEVYLVNRVEDGHHCLLNDLVLQTGDAQRPLPALGLRFIDSPRGLGPVRSAVHPAVQIDQPTLQPGLILPPRHAIHSRCWWSKGVNRSCFLSFAACRTPCSPWDTPASPCVESVCDCEVFSLVRPLSSPTSAAGCSALFGWLIGTAERSDSSKSFMRAVRLLPLPARTAPLVAASRWPGLPVLVHAVSQRARGLRLRRTGQLLALSPLVVLRSPSIHRVGAPN